LKVHHILAPNPGLFTGLGTNTWVIESDGEALVVDPGPDIAAHVTATVETIADLDVQALLVSHSHPDHAPAAAILGEAVAAPVYGFGPGPGFTPDLILGDGDTVRAGRIVAVAIHAPGHTPDSLCFMIDRKIFTGDHVLGGSTVVVEHMGDYLESLQRIIDLKPKTIYPGHGRIVRKPEEWLHHYIEHRLNRERSILAAVEDGALTVGGVVERVYADIDPGLHFAASQSVGAHLRKLASEALVALPYGSDDWDAPVRPALASETE